MAPETVTVGDTEVEIRETDDGFEASAVDDFASYVRDIGGLLMGTNELRTGADMRESSHDAELHYGGGTFTDDEMRALSRDDGITFGSVHTYDGGAVYIGLHDDRDD